MSIPTKAFNCLWVLNRVISPNSPSNKAAVSAPIPGTFGTTKARRAFGFFDHLCRQCFFVRVNLGEVRRNRSFLTVDTVFFNSWIGTLCIVDDLICLLLGTIRGDFFRVSLISLFFIFVRVDANTKSGWGKDGSMSMRKGSACLKRTVQALEKSIEGSCVNPCADE